MIPRLVEAAVPAFTERGIAFPLRVLSTREADGFRRRCDELEAALGGKPRTIEVRQMHLHFRWAYELATHPAILDEVEKLLGPDIVVWATELFSKHPQDANVMIGWHRDGAYMGFAPHEVLTAWVALSDSRVENGCMQAVPGPERLKAQGVDRSASAQRIPEESIDPAHVVNVELNAGEMSIHDSLILHGSRPNLSDRKRVGFAIRYVRGDARPLHGRPPVVLARGAPSADQFECADPPEGEGDMAALKRSAVQHFDAMLVNLQKFPC
jgi:non-haem Fe2+, alpha-ketoglutarate-dependent halogenase